MTQGQPPFPWRKGEHVCVIGDTGSGKTYLLAKRLLRYRQYVCVFKTKPDEDDADKWQGFRKTTRAKTLTDPRYDRILLMPEYRRQAIEGYEMLMRAYRQGGWTIVIDELWYAERIGLTPTIEMVLTQSRSLGISVVIGQQRPVTTTRFAISQSTHLISFRTEGRDTKTVAEATTPRILPVLDSLGQYEFAYYHRAARYVGKGTARTLGSLVVPVERNKSVPESLDKTPEAVKG